MEGRPNSVFQFDEKFDVTKEVQDAFDTNGYIILKNVLDKQEVGKLTEALENAQKKMHVYGRNDGEGGKTKVTLWNNLSDDLVGTVVRSEKMAGTFEKLLGGEIYHYHSKVIMKDARTGGAHVWHQDYGYWYEFGCIFPNMGTIWVPLDRADQSNGCLKILVGSHKLGRINHKQTGDQAGADLERVAHVEKFLPLLHVEVDPGDALYFHCNLLHRSDQNRSDRRRWAFLMSFNRADNDPVINQMHAAYTPMTKVPNSAIKACSTELDPSAWDFFQGPKADASLIKKLDEKPAS